MVVAFVVATTVMLGWNVLLCERLRAERRRSHKLAAVAAKLAEVNATLSRMPDPAELLAELRRQQRARA